jgi:hypothetical protein
VNISEANELFDLLQEAILSIKVDPPRITDDYYLGLFSSNEAKNDCYNRLFEVVDKERDPGKRKMLSAAFDNIRAANRAWANALRIKVSAA